MSEEKKGNWFIKILKKCLFSPINTFFFLALIYFGLQAYVFSPSIGNKISMYAVIVLWIFWFIAKYLIILIFVLAIIGGGAYMYYEHTQKEVRKCEDAGGYWNKNTKSCEKKLTLWEKISKLFEIDTKSPPKEIKNEKTTSKETKEQSGKKS